MPLEKSLSREKRPSPLIIAAILLGMGLAGVTDGILFNHLLQWHQLLSSKIPGDTIDGKAINHFWDGVYHGFSWLLTASGIFLLWSLVGRNDVSRSNRVFFGSFLLGYGIFIFLEGVLNHHILSLHHVNETSLYKMWWDIGFLLVGGLIAITGWITILQKQPLVEKRPTRPMRRIYPVQYIKSKTI